MNTKYNWFRVPKDVTHIAMDKNLSIYGYYSKPEINEEFECWTDRAYKHSPCYLGKGVETDWRNSLEEHPSFGDMIDLIESTIENTLLTEILDKKNETSFYWLTNNCAKEILRKLLK